MTFNCYLCHRCGRSTCNCSLEEKIERLENELKWYREPFFPSDLPKPYSWVFIHYKIPFHGTKLIGGQVLRSDLHEIVVSDLSNRSYQIPVRNLIKYKVIGL